MSILMLSGASGASVPPDTTPNAFSFTDQTNVSLSSTITSAAITVSGINSPATITVSGGTYDINSSGSFTSSSGTVNNGDTVRARHTSSGSNSTATNTVVTIGGVSDTFTSTTEAAEGDLVHGEAFTISGSGFGTKSPAAPLIWDNCSHGQATSARWSAAFPSSGGSNIAMAYRQPGQNGLPSDSLPHSNITSVLSGCHYSGGAGGGYNVGMSFPVTFAEGAPVFCRYLFRNSTGYYYDSGSENYKIWHWDQTADPYGSSTDGYVEFKDFTSASSSPSYKYNSGYHLVSPDELGNSASTYLGGVTGSTPGNEWTEHKWYWLLDRNNGGACYVVTNNENAWSGGTRPTSGNVRVQNVTLGKMAFYYHGQTVPSSGSTIYGQIGGFSRYNDNGTSFRMFADIYVDTTWSRVELANSATYDSATITEPQPPTSWSSTSITCTCNKGRLSSGTVHVFVFDSDNARQYIGTATMT